MSEKSIFTARLISQQFNTASKFLFYFQLTKATMKTKIPTVLLTLPKIQQKRVIRFRRASSKRNRLRRFSLTPLKKRTLEVNLNLKYQKILFLRLGEASFWYGGFVQKRENRISGTYCSPSHRNRAAEGGFICRGTGLTPNSSIFINTNQLSPAQMHFRDTCVSRRSACFRRRTKRSCANQMRTTKLVITKTTIGTTPWLNDQTVSWQKRTRRSRSSNKIRLFESDV